eukprot:GEMP01054730.1.p1 GENE.GEMP01054730.1~~GEMP01054730.1.p1  ORF type:complete len:262 (+),score=64.10 GEMP01054730.1:215-1000(+)
MEFFNLTPTLHGDAIMLPHSAASFHDDNLFNLSGDDPLVSHHHDLDDFFGDPLGMIETPVHVDGTMRHRHHHMRGDLLNHNGPVVPSGSHAINDDNGDTTMIVAQEVVKGPHHAEIIITYRMPKRHVRHAPVHSPRHGYPEQDPSYPPSASNVPPHPLPRQHMPPPAHYRQPPPDIISVFTRPDPPLTTTGIIGGILTIGAQLYLWGYVFTTCFKRPARQAQAQETSPDCNTPPSAETTADSAQEHEENEKNDSPAAPTSQ